MDIHREQVRGVEVRVERGAVGSFEVNPPAMLADRIRDQRADLVDAPATYDGVATKARVAARVAYLDRVLERLDEQAVEQGNAGADSTSRWQSAEAGPSRNFRRG